MHCSIIPSVFGFSRTIELVNSEQKDFYRFWKAYATPKELLICSWSADGAGFSNGRIIQKIDPAQCAGGDPVQEMWIRAVERLERGRYTLRRGQ